MSSDSKAGTKILSERHPYIYKFLKFGFRLFRPWLERLKVVYDTYKTTLPDWSYNAWANTYKNYCYVEKEFRYMPTISVIVPVFNPSASHLLQAVYSVVNQHYENWELVLVNASDVPKLRRQTEALAQIDNRIKVVDVGKNMGISKNTNAAIKNSKGEFIAFFDHDDLLHPCALHSVVETMQGSRLPDMVYTDEDKINEDSS